jgi:hypothetical protein
VSAVIVMATIVEDFPPETFVLELPPGESFEPPPDYPEVPLDRLQPGNPSNDEGPARHRV